MKRIVSRSSAMDIARKALAQGATLQVPTITWDASGSCTEPVALTLEGREGARTGDTRPPAFLSGFDGHPIFIDMKVSCRTKCASCLKKRSFRWALSINKELKEARRSWMVTLTMKPDYLVWAKLEATSRYKGDIDYANVDQQFRALCVVIGEDLTLYLKRLRQRLVQKLRNGALGEYPTFRYCAVFEKHKSGEPHIHVMVHEKHNGCAILWEDLVRDQTTVFLGPRVVATRWPNGHVEAHLVKNLGKGWYLAKYLSKEAASRVRASQGYFLKQDVDLINVKPAFSGSSAQNIN